MITTAVFAGKRLGLRVEGLSEKGSTREVNEDSIAIVKVWEETDRSASLFILADGLGGHAGGEIASSMVTNELPKALKDRSGLDVLTNLVASVYEINDIILNAGISNASLSGMCATIVAALVVNNLLYLIHVGDSRGYLFRAGRLLHRTRDHSYLETFGPEKSRFRPRFGHVLTQSIGCSRTVAPGLGIYQLEPGDRILLCSDGISDVISSEEMQHILESSPTGTASRALLDRAAAKGSTDDLSVVVVEAGMENPEA
jgi:PPM family protein phosphatase